MVLLCLLRSCCYFCCCFIKTSNNGSKLGLYKSVLSNALPSLHHSSVWLMIAVITLLQLLLPVHSSYIRSPEFCDGIGGSRAPKHLLYTDKGHQPLTIVASEWPSQQLLSEVVAVLLRQMMGYRDVEVFTCNETDNSSLSVLLNSPLQRQPCMEKYQALRPGNSRALMMDLLAWSSPAHVGILDQYNTVRYLGTGGRFGWFLPAEMIENKDPALLEHWRVYTNKINPALKTFYRSKEELANISALFYNNEGKPHCSESWCVGSMFTPARCAGPDAVCATLFASNTAAFAVQVVERLAPGAHEFSSLLAEYSRHLTRRSNYSSIACEWLQKNLN
ncbi:uncharacterized protein LOC108676309 [Hyalella azteca]|uniref:Uncharacterized protein LOC108676309 n=1 Tax=Hyalella azteca TaxID=294128 RepID=A0A979FJ72_HYAAZ|nr:uncharacterized protein LOC108676309 [Hyalella azteca]